MKNLRQSLLFAPALVIASMTSLTVGASIAKSLFPVFGATGTTVLRLGLAALMMLVFWRPWRTSFTRAQWKVFFAYGIGLALMNLMFYEAIARLPIGIAIAIEFLGPLSVAFYMSRSKLDILWALLAMVGILLILPLTENQAPIDLVGVGFALGAAAAWAFYIVIGQKAGSNSHSGTVTAIGMSIGAVTALPFGAIPAFSLFQHAEFIPSALAVALLSSAIPYSLEMIALKEMDSKNFGILLSLEPAIGAVSAYFFLTERLSVLQLFAIFCVICASVGSTITASRKKMRERLEAQTAAP